MTLTKFQTCFTLLLTLCAFMLTMFSTAPNSSINHSQSIVNTATSMTDPTMSMDHDCIEEISPSVLSHDDCCGEDNISQRCCSSVSSSLFSSVSHPVLSSLPLSKLVLFQSFTANVHPKFISVPIRPPIS